MKSISELIREKKKEFAYKAFSDILLWKIPHCLRVKELETLFDSREIDQMGTIEEKMFFSLFSTYKVFVPIPTERNSTFNLIFSYFYRKFEPENLNEASVEARQIVRENPIIFVYTHYGDCSLPGSLVEDEIEFEPMEDDGRFVQIEDNVVYILDAFKQYKTREMLRYILENNEIFQGKMY